jgi:hypothetical protein
MTATLAAPAAPGSKIEFPNLHSRLLLRRHFERQSSIPDDPPWLVEKSLRFLERVVLRVNLRGIRVDRPIFLLGLPRSGTTMLQDLCCTHPGLAYFTNVMHQFPSCFGAAEMLRKNLKLDARGERFIGDSIEVAGGSPNEGLKFFGTWFGWDAYSPHYEPRDPESFTRDEIARIHETIRKAIWCFGRPWRRFFSKNPGAIPDMPRLNRIFPDGKFLHIVRDPRNCANSMRKLYQAEKRQQAFLRSLDKSIPKDRPVFIPYPRVPKLPEYLDQYGPDDVRTTAHVWNDCIDMVNAYKGQMRNFLEVRFEDFVVNPKDQMARIFDFCELPQPEIDNFAFWDQMCGVGKVHHTNRYGEYGVIEEICRANMQKLGYE